MRNRTVGSSESAEERASRPPEVDAVAAREAVAGAETSNAATLRGAPEVGDVAEDPSSSEDVTMATLEGDLPEGETERRNAEAALARELERALLEEERTMALLREMEQLHKEEEERCLRTLALERFAQQSDTYKKRVEVAQRQQESLRKQIESFRRAGISEDLAPAHVPFREEGAEVPTREAAEASFGQAEAE